MSGCRAVGAGDFAAGPEVAPLRPTEPNPDAKGLSPAWHRELAESVRGAACNAGEPVRNSELAGAGPRDNKDCPALPLGHYQSGASRGAVSNVSSYTEPGRSAARRTQPRGFLAYFWRCCAGTGASSLAAVLLWSSMGLGKVCLQTLVDGYAYRVYSMAGSVGIFLVLYLLDFFCPPHMPGQFMLLWEGDAIVGRAIFGTGLALVLLAMLLLARLEPSVPLTGTICLGPAAVTGVWLRFCPAQSDLDVQAEASSEKMSRKMRALRSIVLRELDEIRFFKAALSAFMLNFLVVLVAWAMWVATGNTLESSRDGAARWQPGSGNTAAVSLILWVAPLVVAVSNLVFGLFVSMRVLLNRSYSNTDALRNELLAQGMRRRESDSGFRYGDTLEAANPESREAQDLPEVQDANSRRLSTIIKVVVCCFILLLGGIFFMGQFMHTDVEIAGMVIELATVFLLAFLLFAYVSFRRVVVSIKSSLVQLPAYKVLEAVFHQDWPRALVLCFVAPVVPLLLSMSAANQAVRQCRGLHDAGSPRLRGAATCPPKGPARRRILTARVAAWWLDIGKWSWASVLLWCHIFCGCYVCLALCPLFLNIGLSWLNREMDAWDFRAIVLITFAVGVVSFMLPPVPGAIVYLFGGLVLSNNCPWGFWPGSVFNIAICLIMKLVACAVQQKCIGELLGQSHWVRQTIGVHKLGIRCLEAILRKPGMSIAKVAILCGGPDWPTSVLAGILKLSLVQCELGTLPIVGLIAPYGLTGSLYLKRGTDEMWTRLADLTVVVSTILSLILMVTVAWAVQVQLDESCEELSRPLPENVHLHWLDHRAAEIKQHSFVSWADLPQCIRVLYALGALIHIAVFHAFLWQLHTLFGRFKITDDIDDIKWWGDGGVFNLSAVAILVIYALGWLCYAAYCLWERARTRGPRTEAVRRLAEEEAAWKERWLLEARGHAAAETGGLGPPCSHGSPRPRGPGPRQRSWGSPARAPGRGPAQAEEALGGACEARAAVGAAEASACARQLQDAPSEADEAARSEGTPQPDCVEAARSDGTPQSDPEETNSVATSLQEAAGRSSRRSSASSGLSAASRSSGCRAEEEAPAVPAAPAPEAPGELPGLAEEAPASGAAEARGWAAAAAARSEASRASPASLASRKSRASATSCPSEGSRRRLPSRWSVSVERLSETSASAAWGAVPQAADAATAAGTRGPRSLPAPALPEAPPPPPPAPEPPGGPEQRDFAVPMSDALPRHVRRPPPLSGVG